MEQMRPKYLEIAEDQQDAKIELSPAIYSRSDAPREMLYASESYEKKYRINFETLSYFSTMLLNELHRSEGDPTEVSENVTISSFTDKSILKDINILSEIVNNNPLPTDEEKLLYFETLKLIYSKLLQKPIEACWDDNSLILGIEREGRILAEALGWLPSEHSLHPDAKRIPYKSGLLIGFGEVRLEGNYNNCVIIDGAIASGATIITAIEQLRSQIKSFEIYSVHSSYEGIRAIERYCQSVDVKAKIIVGHATTGISSKYYAIDPTNTMRTVVGDLGDMISNFS